MKLVYNEIHTPVRIELPLSKSISNRLLIIQALSKKKIKVRKHSEAEDTIILQKALESSEEEVNVGMAGTTFRFLTAYFSILPNLEKKLFGAPRMNERPIGILVEALNGLGGKIVYLGKKGFPPIKIKGDFLEGGKLSISSSISSQYISALLLIAPYLKNGLILTLQGKVISKPYIEMTISLMRKLGANVQQHENEIKVFSGKYSSSSKIEVESDWSSAAFFYQFFAFSDQSNLDLIGLSLNSVQGDKKIKELFTIFGVQTKEIESGVRLSKMINFEKRHTLFMEDCPDLVPSLAVCAAVLKEETVIYGVKSLRIKESNRVKALENELAKIGATLVDQSLDCIKILGTKKVPRSLSFQTYNDHRMAMCLAPLCALNSKLEIDSKEVVNKSFPNFWQELAKCGITIG